MSYQSFPDRPGSSQSEDKFSALALPSLKNKSVLDLGCNEGFFCDKVHQLGASRVLGIDRNQKSIENAKERFPDLEFRCQSWEVLPDEKFDIILLLSAIHYAKDQKELLDRIRSILAPGGILVLECGVAAGDDARWVKAHRNVGSVLFPTQGMLYRFLLKDFAVRRCGSSVMQKGDPVPRYVYHATPRQPILILVGGSGKTGKTTLCREMSGVDFFSLDRHMRSLVQYEKTDLANFLKTDFDGQKLGSLYQKLDESEFVSDFVASIFECLPRLTIGGIEGAALQLPNIKKAIEAKAIEQSFVVWEMSRIV